VPGRREIQPLAVRDALGFVRLLYEAERAGGADTARLARIAEAGRALSTAAKYLRLEPDSMGYRAAPEQIRKGMEQLSAVPWPANVGELVKAARRRALP